MGKKSIGNGKNKKSSAASSLGSMFPEQKIVLRMLRKNVPLSQWRSFVDTGDGCGFFSQKNAEKDAQAIFTWQHDIQHEQVNALTLHDPLQGTGIFGQQHIETLLRQVAPQQVADAGVVIHDNDLVQTG